MYEDVLDAIKSLESFALRARDRSVPPPFPVDAVRVIGADRDPALPPGLAGKGAHAIVEAVQAVTDRAFNPDSAASFPAQDLLALRPAVETLGGLRAAPDACVPFLTSLLEATTFEAYGGSEKGSAHYRGGSDVDDAHDELAAACVASVSRFRANASGAMNALKGAFEHRSREVRGLAKDVYAAIEYHLG